MRVKDRFEIADTKADGSERVLSDEFTSAKDAYIACVYDLSLAGLPVGVVKRQVRHVETKEWVCEWAVKSPTR